MGRENCNFLAYKKGCTQCGISAVAGGVNSSFKNRAETNALGSEEQSGSGVHLQDHQGYHCQFTRVGPRGKRPAVN